MWKSFGILLLSLIALSVLPSKVEAGYQADLQADFTRELSKKFNLNESDVRGFLNDYNRNNNAEHVEYIDRRLQRAVDRRRINDSQKNAISQKIKSMMVGGPTNYQYCTMNDDELDDHIADWKREMTQWAKDNDLTLSKIRSITGKGNKYLMGINY